jgi:TolA-binding protein
MKRILWVSILLLSLLFFSGCSDQKAQELFDTAKLEEQQNNPAHARELYQRIVKEYPDSPVADEARRRLQSLQNAEQG